jgi:NAD(P)-dependent dehydrogenase (short-subunit alcohol dehydrogenase family)
MSSLKYVNKLQGKRVLLFGGTSGIGFGVAEASIENGADVIIAGSNPERLQSTMARLKKSYPDVKESRLSTYHIDLSALEQVGKALEVLFQKVTNEGSRKLDHVVYTAGDWGNFSSIQNITVADIQPALAVRLLVPVLMAKCIPQYLHSSPESSFTLTSGTNTARPEKGWALAALIGGGTEALIRGLAVDFAPIRVNCVSPGLIETEATVGLIQSSTRQVMENGVLTAEIGRPEDAAEAYLYFMKDKFVTGTLLSSDGGRLLLGPKFNMKDDFLETYDQK